MIPRHKLFSVLSRQNLALASSALAALILAGYLHSSHSSLANAGAAKSQGTLVAIGSAQDTPAGCCGDEGDNKPHLLAGAYYTLKNNFSAKLLLNNKGPLPIEVQPTFFSMSGERFEAPSVVIAGNTHQFLNLADSVAAAGQQFREGSIQLFHRGKDLVLGAQIYLTDDPNSLSFDEKLSEPSTSTSSGLAGVWWLPSPKGAVDLVISNTTEAAFSVSTKIRGEAPKREANTTFDLMPHETKILEVQSELVGGHGAMSRFGAISVEHNGPRGGVLARAMAHDASVGYSLPIQFSDPKAGKSTSIQGAGLRIGKAGNDSLSPKVIAHNAGETETTLNGRVPYTTSDGGNGEVYLPQVQLSPGETEVIDVVQSLRAHGVPSNVAAAGLEFEYTGDPGSVITSAFSVSRSGNQVFRVPLWDIAAQRSATGGYPWYIEGDSSTIVYIKNVTDEPRQYMLQLRHDGGVYALGLKTVEARQTVVLDIRALRDQQVPDESGRTIPWQAASGQVNWSMRGPQNQVLIGRSEQVDVARGISSNYACMNCCPDSFANGWIDPGSVQGFVGDTTQFNGFEQTMSCYGTLSPPYNPWPSWDSTDWNVASCDGSGMATAEGPGTANIQARWLAYEWGNFESGNPNECYERPLDILAEALCDVLARRIDSVSPERALIGQPVDVTITGSGFGTGTPTVSAESGIAVSNVQLINSGEVRARFTIATNAPAGNHGVSVTTSTGQFIVGGNFFVQIPGRLGRFNYSGAPAGYGPLTLTSSTNNEVRNVVGTTLLTNQCGVYRNLVYQLEDQQGQPLAIAFDFTETFSNYSGVSTLPANLTGHSSAGLVQDTQYFGKTLPNCPGSNDNESFDQRFIVTLNGIQYSLSTIVRISRGRFAGDWKVDVTTTTP